MACCLRKYAFWIPWSAVSIKYIPLFSEDLLLHKISGSYIQWQTHLVSLHSHPVNTAWYETGNYEDGMEFRAAWCSYHSLKKTVDWLLMIRKVTRIHMMIEGYYFIWQILFDTSRRLSYHINVPHSTDGPDERGGTAAGSDNICQIRYGHCLTSLFFQKSF